MAEKEKAPRKNRSPLELSCQHLPETLFHNSSRRVRVKSSSLLGYGEITAQKILLTSREVKRKIAFENIPNLGRFPWQEQRLWLL